MKLVKTNQEFQKKFHNIVYSNFRPKIVSKFLKIRKIVLIKRPNYKFLQKLKMEKKI